MLCASIHFPVIVCLFRLGHWMFGVPYTHYGPGMLHHMLDTFWEDPTSSSSGSAWTPCTPSRRGL